MTTDQFESILRPLAEEFATKVAAAVSQHLRERVGTEVQAVMERAFGGAMPAQLKAVPAVPVAAPAAPATKAPPVKARTRRKTSKATTAPKVTCSKSGCGQNWYRPSGSAKKLCYKHFLEAGGTAPPGKKPGAGKKEAARKRPKKR